jgi:outer membrane protein OmpA-like peptidoglycan-associated protein
MFWAQAVGGGARYAQDENSVYAYKDNSYGIMIGAQGYVANKLKAGIFGEYKRNDIKQDKSSAQIDNIGGGVYGGYIGDILEIRALLFGIYNKYSTERFINYTNPYIVTNTAFADFGALTFGGDLEISFKYKLDRKSKVSVRPYIGIEANATNYGAFEETGASYITFLHKSYQTDYGALEETGANALNLNVDKGAYKRSSIRFGGEVKYDAGKIFVIYASIENKYLLTGAESEIKAKFVNTEYEFASRGFNENPLIMVFGSGIEARLARYYSLFANANYFSGADYTNLVAIAGIKYKFGYWARLKKTNKRKVKELNYDKLMSEIEKSRREAIRITEKMNYKQLLDEQEPNIGFVANIEYFDIGSHKLSNDAKEFIKKISDKIKVDGGRKVYIEGYADDGKTQKQSEKIAFERARVVYDEFVENDIDDKRLSVEIYTRNSAYSQNYNRRTEIFVD